MYSPARYGIRPSCWISRRVSNRSRAFRWACLAGGFVAALTTPVSPLRVGVTLAAPGGMRPQAEIGAAVERVAALLARSGHQVKEFAFPDSATVGDPALVIWLTAIAEEIDFYRGRVGRAPERHELDALTWAGIDMGNSRSALDYARARRALTAATAGMARVFDEFDVLLLPTAADFTPPIGQIDGRTAAFNLDRWNAESYGYAPYTEIFNVTGQPAMSLPARHVERRYAHRGADRRALGDGLAAPVAGRLAGARAALDGAPGAAASSHIVKFQYRRKSQNMELRPLPASIRLFGVCAKFLQIAAAL
jgi:hypothetical protein